MPKKTPAKSGTSKSSTKKKSATKKPSKKPAATTAVKKTAAKKPSLKSAVKATARKAAVKASVKARPKRTEKDSASPLSAREKKILKIKERLQKQRSQLLAEAETAINALPEQTIFPDLGDQASVETDRNFMLRLKGREQRLIKKIEETLERIDRGDYGICEVCGEDIRTQRLEARPVTSLCIECKTEQEEEEKLIGS